MKVVQSCLEQVKFKKLYINKSIKKFYKKKLIQKRKIYYTLCFHKFTFLVCENLWKQSVLCAVYNKHCPMNPKYFLCIFFPQILLQLLHAEPFYQCSQTPQSFSQKPELAKTRLCACMSVFVRERSEWNRSQWWFGSQAGEDNKLLVISPN